MAEGKRIGVVDPSTEKRIASVANATVADAIKAVDAAYQAGAAWAATAVGTENLKSSGDGVRPGWGVNE